MPNLLNSRLIVLDGLPGSSKTTTGQWLTSRLRAQKLNTCWLPETEVSHPLWWYEHWNGTNYQPPDFEKISVETYVQMSLGKWQDFTDLTCKADQPYIAESVFFQNAVAMFLMGGAEEAMLVEYAQEVQKITKSLNPMLIYFYQNDVDVALRKICTIRGQAFEEELLHHMERFPYLYQRNLKGLDGVTTLWQNIRAITDTLFDEYAGHKLAIETSEGNWQAYRQQILEFLNPPA
jgi:hypothetical protein